LEPRFCFPDTDADGDEAAPNQCSTEKPQQHPLSASDFSEDILSKEEFAQEQTSSHRQSDSTNNVNRIHGVFLSRRKESKGQASMDRENLNRSIHTSATEGASWRLYNLRVAFCPTMLAAWRIECRSSVAFGGRLQDGITLGGRGTLQGWPWRDQGGL
jgi:hypothetical protein